MRLLLHSIASVLVFSVPMTAGASTVRGAVVDQSGAPIDGASVGLYTESGSWETLADRSGRFLLENVPAGDYEFEIIARGFASHLEREYKVGEGDPAPLLITLKVGSSPPCPVGFTFIHGLDSLCYSGWDYTDASGKPALSGTVFAFDDGYPNRQATHEPLAEASVILTRTGQAKPSASSTTDQKGRFRFSDLAVARYEVWVKHTGCSDGGTYNVRIKYQKDADIVIDLWCSQTSH